MNERTLFFNLVNQLVVVKTSNKEIDGKILARYVNDILRGNDSGIPEEYAELSRSVCEMLDTKVYFTGEEI